MARITTYKKDCNCDAGHVFYGSGCRMRCKCVKSVKVDEFDKTKHVIVWDKRYNDLSEKDKNKLQES